jgi:integrase
MPKGGRLRYVPLTVRLAAALKQHRHLRGPRVLCQDDGAPLGQRLVQGLVLRAARSAGLRNVGVHVLRTRSARIWRCVEGQRGPYKSSPDTATLSRLSVICT